MAEYKNVAIISVVTDSENFYDKIGDIEGGFTDVEWLEKHIINYGSQGLLFKLAAMTSTIIQTEYEIMRKKDMGNSVFTKQEVCHESL